MIEYLLDWTDINKIQMVGWSGSKSFDKENGCLIFTAINGWRTFGWQLENITGEEIIFEFDYKMLDMTNLTEERFRCYVINEDKAIYGTMCGVPLLKNENWNHYSIAFSSAKPFIGINLRGEDKTGQKVVMALDNVRIYKKSSETDLHIQKNGNIKLNYFTEYSVTPPKISGYSKAERFTPATLSRFSLPSAKEVS